MAKIKKLNVHLDEMRQMLVLLMLEVSRLRTVSPEDDGFVEEAFVEEAELRQGPLT